MAFRFHRNIRPQGLLLLVCLLLSGISVRGGNYSGSIQSSQFGLTLRYSISGVTSATLLKNANAYEFSQWHTVYLNANTEQDAEFENYISSVGILGM